MCIGKDITIGINHELAVALYVKKEYLIYARQLMVDAYGDVFAYAHQALGFGPDQVEALRRNLLE